MQQRGGPLTDLVYVGAEEGAAVVWGAGADAPAAPPVPAPPPPVTVGAKGHPGKYCVVEGKASRPCAEQGLLYSVSERPVARLMAVQRRNNNGLGGSQARRSPRGPRLASRAPGSQRSSPATCCLISIGSWKQTKIEARNSPSNLLESALAAPTAGAAAPPAMLPSVRLAIFELSSQEVHGKGGRSTIKPEMKRGRRAEREQRAGRAERGSAAAKQQAERCRAAHQQQQLGLG